MNDISMDKKTKGQKTQELIIEKSLLLFGKNGFSNTSMQMIANECQFSQGAVMQHFPSKMRLLEAVRKYVTRSNNQFVDSKILPTDDGLTALKKHIEANLSWALKHRSEALIIYLTYETGIYDDEYSEVAAGAARLGTERILRYILAAQREKLIELKMAPMLYAEMIHEYTLGMVLRNLNIQDSTKATLEMGNKINLFLCQIFNLDIE